MVAMHGVFAGPSIATFSPISAFTRQDFPKPLLPVTIMESVPTSSSSFLEAPKLILTSLTAIVQPKAGWVEI